MDLPDPFLNLLIWFASLNPFQQQIPEVCRIIDYCRLVRISDILLMVGLTSMLEQVAQALVCLSFGNLQGGRFCSLSGQHVPGFNHADCEKYFPNWRYSCFLFLTPGCQPSSYIFFYPLRKNYFFYLF